MRLFLRDIRITKIDEFDEMPEDDGMAAHKAVEQQTIPIAKVSITTTLNSYCSVLAAAILVSGCLEEMKRVDNNFMLTILPHFDMIFIVKVSTMRRGR